MPYKELVPNVLTKMICELNAVTSSYSRVWAFGRKESEDRDDWPGDNVELIRSINGDSQSKYDRAALAVWLVDSKLIYNVSRQDSGCAGVFKLWDDPLWNCQSLPEVWQRVR